LTALASLVGASQRVRATSSRLAKVRELAAFLRSLSPDEIEIAVLYLSGDTPQGRSGLGYASLRAAADASSAAPTASLSIAATNQSLATLATIRGTGSATRRAQELRDLLARATSDERDFLLPLLAGELRQGALEGVMLDAIVSASGLPVASLRRAAMHARTLGAVARAALVDFGKTGLRIRFRPGGRPAGEEIACLEVAAIAGVMRQHLGERPVHVPEVRPHDAQGLDVRGPHLRCLQIRG